MQHIVDTLDGKMGSPLRWKTSYMISLQTVLLT